MQTCEELRHVNLGDLRLNRRLRRLVDALAHSPEASLPLALGADAPKAYQFFDNPLVHPDDIRRGHYQDTLRRCDPLPPEHTLLLPSDTTFLDYSDHPQAQGLGYLQVQDSRGLCCHTTLVLTQDGVPLGMLDQQLWVRSPQDYGKRQQRRHKPTADKESQRWLDALDACQSLPPGRRAVFLGDREADFYDLFAHPRRDGLDLLIRAKSRRALVNEDRLLGQAVHEAPLLGEITIRVPRKDAQPERTAVLHVRVLACQIAPPATHPQRKTLAPIALTVIEVVETAPPAGVKPLRWLLLTNRTVSTLAEAAELVGWYALRWRGERYHYTLKSGCQVEQLQLETAARLERALAVYSIVALRLLRLLYLSRTEPELPCTMELSPTEQEVLWAATGSGPPKERSVAAWTLREAVRRLAKLGGYQGRGPKAKPPGVKVLWRGLRRLADLVRGYLLAQKQHEQTSTIVNKVPMNE